MALILKQPKETEELKEHGGIIIASDETGIYIVFMGSGSFHGRPTTARVYKTSSEGTTKVITEIKSMMKSNNNEIVILKALKILNDLDKSGVITYHADVNYHEQDVEKLIEGSPKHFLNKPHVMDPEIKEQMRSEEQARINQRVNPLTGDMKVLFDRHREFRQRYPDSVIFLLYGPEYITFGTDALECARIANVDVLDDGEFTKFKIAVNSIEMLTAKLKQKGYEVAFPTEISQPKEEPVESKEPAVEPVQEEKSKKEDLTFEPEEEPQVTYEELEKNTNLKEKPKMHKDALKATLENGNQYPGPTFFEVLFTILGAVKKYPVTFTMQELENGDVSIVLSSSLFPGLSFTGSIDEIVNEFIPEFMKQTQRKKSDINLIALIDKTLRERKKELDGKKKKKAEKKQEEPAASEKKEEKKEETKVESGTLF